LYEIAKTRNDSKQFQTNPTTQTDEPIFEPKIIDDPSWTCSPSVVGC